jgi:hypothetical protein
LAAIDCTKPSTQPVAAGGLQQSSSNAPFSRQALEEH